jgi:hypothetical protein
MDAARPLRHAQRDVVVLRAVERGAEPSRVFDDAAAVHQQVAEEHRRIEVLGRPVRLEERLDVRAVEVQLVLVGVDDVGVGMPVEQLDDLEKRVGRDLVVVIQQRDELAVRRAERGIGRG